MTGTGTGYDGEAQVLHALSELEQRLSLALNTGLAAVTQSIAQLAEQHHRTQLEQEKRNASFADRSRLEELAGKVSAMDTTTVLLAQMRKDIDADRSRLDQLESMVNERALRFAHGAIGYIVMFLVMLSSNVLVYILAHLVAK
jgi:phosphate starvation-inducible protein PhoH